MPEMEIELERVYNVPLSRAWIAPRHRRVVRAVNVLREFAERHMKSSDIKIDSELNETLWKRGITKPPRRITVKMTKDEDGLVTISLPKAVKEEAEKIEKKPEVAQLPEAVPQLPEAGEQKIEAIPSESATLIEAKVEAKKPTPKRIAPKKKPVKVSAAEKKKKPAKKSKGSAKK